MKKLIYKWLVFLVKDSGQLGILMYSTGLSCSQKLFYVPELGTCSD